MALRERVRETLNEMSDKYIIEPVTKPTEWISSMVVVTKKSGQLRLCLDPKRLELCNSTSALSSSGDRISSYEASWS